MSISISAVATTLLSFGLPADVVATVQVIPLPDDQAMVTIGYDKAGRRKVTAQTLSSMDAALATVADRDRIAGLIALGVRAMPASARPVLPAWVAESEAVARHDAMKARAGSIADKAAGLPWAA